MDTLRPTNRAELQSSDSMESGGKALLYVWALEQETSRRGWRDGDEQDVLVPWVTNRNPAARGSDNTAKVFHRYYHLYRQGELERDIFEAGGTAVESGYEKDNWWAIVIRRVDT